VNNNSPLGKYMAFVLQLQTQSKQFYIQNYVVAILREFGIFADVKRENDTLSFSMDETNPKIQEALEKIAAVLPASLFLNSSSNVTTEENLTAMAELDLRYPLNLGLCPSCQKELFDVSSRRYYYPFISCSCCGGNYSFVSSYPYKRENTSMKFIRPCENCHNEMQKPGLRESHALNSCHECGIPVRMVSKSAQRYANDAGSFRTMFEVAAKAIVDHKRLLVKTTFGYRLFYEAKLWHSDAVFLMINASKITDNLALITEEFHALLSIERPIMHVTLKDEKLKEIAGANTAYVKYPDEGFTILLATELQKLGVAYIAYEDVDEDCEADIKIDYDLELDAQQDMRFFLNKDTHFIAEGDRVSFPSLNLRAKNIVSIAEEYAGIPQGDTMFFDKMHHLQNIAVMGANVLEGDKERYHEKQRYFSADEGAFMAVIAEHELFGTKAVGAYFDEEPSFLYYDGKNVLRIVPPKHFKSSNILAEIASLREGSDRLVENLQKQLPDVYAKLEALQHREDVKLFEAVAIVLGLQEHSMKAVSIEAMKFVGKGGIQIDTHIKDNRFDHAAFLASIISYQLAGVSSVILAYSIFESFGDYFYEILSELQSKTKATEIILCGKHFANQSLFSRMQRNLKVRPPYMSKNYPIGKESAVVGGVYI
jgi:hydrogenase maturation factor HypF (carbamoyltransferase family)